MSFEYHRPSTLDEACELLSKEGAFALAGGTDLLVNTRSGKDAPAHVVDLKHIRHTPGLRDIYEKDGWIRVGALATMNDIAKSPLLQGDYGFFAASARVEGCYEIRLRATLGGNLWNASPGADTGSPLAVVEAEVELYGAGGGTRRLPVADFLLGPGRHAGRKGEVLTGVWLPPLPVGAKGWYRRLSRVRGQDLASMSIAVLVVNPSDVPSREIRLALGAVNPTPWRASEVEEMVRGVEITPALLKKVRESLYAGLSPRATSLRATPAYKKEMSVRLFELALKELGVLNGGAK